MFHVNICSIKYKLIYVNLCHETFYLLQPVTVIYLPYKENAHKNKVGLT